MITRLFQIAKKLGVTVIFLNEFNGGGCYLPEYNVIYIEEGLPDHQLIYVLAHELSHVTEHKDSSATYTNSQTGHSKIEHEAELGAITTVIEHFYSHDDLELDQFNYVRLMDYYEIDYSFEPIVKELLLDYIRHAC